MHGDEDYFTVEKTVPNQDSCCSSLFRNEKVGVPYINKTEECAHTPNPTIVVKSRKTCRGTAYNEHVDACCKGKLYKLALEQGKECCGNDVYSKSRNVSCCSDVVTSSSRLEQFNFKFFSYEIIIKRKHLL